MKTPLLGFTSFEVSLFEEPTYDFNNVETLLQNKNFYNGFLCYSFITLWKQKFQRKVMSFLDSTISTTYKNKLI
jgi:uncharacterized membrane protein